MSTDNKYYIGIDIGKKGGIFIKPPSGIGHTLACEMPCIGKELDYLSLCKLLEPYRLQNTLVIFEKLGVIYGTSKSTAFSMGTQCGAVEMLCTALSLPYVKVHAKTWQKEMFKGVGEIRKLNGSRDTKAMALSAIKQIMPSQKLIVGRAKKEHDGIVDAALLSEYAARKEL